MAKIEGFRVKNFKPLKAEAERGWPGNPGAVLHHGSDTISERDLSARHRRTATLRPAHLSRWGRRPCGALRHQTQRRYPATNRLTN